MGRAQIITITGLAACAVLVSSCRQPRRGLRVGSDAASLQVNMGGLEKNDQGRKDLIYELSSCVAPLNGVLTEGTEVEFKDVGLKKGLTGCQLRVKTTAAPADIVPVGDSEPGVLYWAKDFAIKQDQAGALVANAGLQRLYTEKPNSQRSSFKLEVPIKFPKPENDKPLTAALVCATAVANVGVYQSQNPDAGTFEFTIPVAEEFENNCNQILVSAGGVLHKYRGEFGANGKFKATPNGSWKAGEIALTLQVTTPPSTGPGDDAVSVSTSGGGKCPAGTVFDVDQKACVKK